MSQRNILRTSPAELDKTAALSDAVANMLIDRHFTLAGRMTELFNSGWSGPAADAARAAWQEWDSGFRRVIAGLNDESTALQMAAAAYRSADEGGAGTIAGAGQQF